MRRSRATRTAQEFNELTNKASAAFEKAITNNRRPAAVRTNGTPKFSNDRYKVRENIGRTHEKVLNMYIANLRNYYTRKSRAGGEGPSNLNQFLFDERLKHFKSTMKRVPISLEGPILIRELITAKIGNLAKYLKDKGQKLRDLSGSAGLIVKTYNYSKSLSNDIVSPYKVNIFTKGMYSISLERSSITSDRGSIVFSLGSPVKEYLAHALALLQQLLDIPEAEIDFSNSKKTQTYMLCLGHKIDYEKFENVITSDPDDGGYARNKIIEAFGKDMLTKLYKDIQHITSLSKVPNSNQNVSTAFRGIQFKDKAHNITYNMFQNGRIIAMINDPELKKEIFPILEKYIDIMEKAGVRIITESRSSCQSLEGYTSTQRKVIQRRLREHLKRHGNKNQYSPNSGTLPIKRYVLPLATGGGFVLENSEAKGINPATVIQSYLKYHPNINIENAAVRAKYGLNRIGVNSERIKKEKAKLNKGKGPATANNGAKPVAKSGKKVKAATENKIPTNLKSKNWVFEQNGNIKYYGPKVVKGVLKVNKGKPFIGPYKLSIRPTRTPANVAKSLQNMKRNFGMLKTFMPHLGGQVPKEILKKLVPEGLRQRFGVQISPNAPSPAPAPAPAPPPAPSPARSNSRSRSRSSSANNSNNNFARELEEHMLEHQRQEESAERRNRAAANKAAVNRAAANKAAANRAAANAERRRQEASAERRRQEASAERRRKEASAERRHRENQRRLKQQAQNAQSLREAMLRPFPKRKQWTPPQSIRRPNVKPLSSAELAKLLSANKKIREKNKAKGEYGTMMGINMSSLKRKRTPSPPKPTPAPARKNNNNNNNPSPVKRTGRKSGTVKRGPATSIKNT